MEKPEKKREQQDKPGKKPPGQFVSDHFEQQTARFIEEVKGRAQRRQELQDKEGRGPPPRGPGNQRSSRR